MDVIVDKMEDIYSGVVDSEHVRKAYELEIKEYMEKGCLIIPSSVFDKIQTMYFDELYRISRLVK